MRYAFLRDRSSFRGHARARAQKHPLPPAVATNAISFIIQERRARLRERRRTRRRTDGRWNIERRIREMEPMAFSPAQPAGPRKRPCAFAVCQGAQPVFLHPAAKNGLNMRIQRAFPSLIPIGYGRASPLREHSGALIRSSSRRALCRRATGRSGSVHTAGFSATDTKRPKYTVTLYPIFVCRSTRF